jgi:voltage-gated potassium channel
MTKGPPRPGSGPRPQLLRKSSLTGWRSFILRTLAAAALLLVALSVHWFDRTGLRDNVDGTVSFLDVLYFTMITVTTVGYGDIVPVTPRARMFDTFVVTPVRLFLWLIFLGTAYSFILRRTWDKWRMASIQRTLNDHVVVAGYGRSGTEAALELVSRGAAPKAIVVIDPRETGVADAKEAGFNVVEGDATRNAVLATAHIAQARALIVSAGRDDTSILIVLTARKLAPELCIAAVIREPDNEILAKQAGANTVVNPVSFSGLLLASSTKGPYIADYLADLVSQAGDAFLHERPVTASEVGKPLSAIATGLGVRVHREDRHFGFGSSEAQALRRGDIVVEIRSGAHPAD